MGSSKYSDAPTKFVSDVELAHRFKYHPPTDAKAMLHSQVRDRVHEVAKYLNDNVPECPEKSLALRDLEGAVMWANAAIARNPLPTEGSSS